MSGNSFRERCRILSDTRIVEDLESFNLDVRLRSLWGDSSKEPCLNAFRADECSG